MSDEKPIQTDYDDLEYPNHSEFQFDTIFDSDLTSEDFEKVRVAARVWSRTNHIPCELVRNDKGFEARLRHFCHDGNGIASDLFIFLARNVFREIDKSVSYRLADLFEDSDSRNLPESGGTNHVVGPVSNLPPTTSNTSAQVLVKKGRRSWIKREKSWLFHILMIPAYLIVWGLLSAASYLLMGGVILGVAFLYFDNQSVTAWVLTAQLPIFIYLAFRQNRLEEELGGRPTVVKRPGGADFTEFVEEVKSEVSFDTESKIKILDEYARLFHNDSSIVRPPTTRGGKLLGALPSVLFIILVTGMVFLIWEALGYQLIVNSYFEDGPRFLGPFCLVAAIYWLHRRSLYKGQIQGYVNGQIDAYGDRDGHRG